MIWKKNLHSAISYRYFGKILEKTPENDELAKISKILGHRISRFAFFREIWVLAVNILNRFGFIREIWGLAVLILTRFSFILEKRLHR